MPRVFLRQEFLLCMFIFTTLSQCSNNLIQCFTEDLPSERKSILEQLYVSGVAFSSDYKKLIFVVSENEATPLDICDVT
jgi:hypothetical protein